MFLNRKIVAVALAFLTWASVVHSEEAADAAAIDEATPAQVAPQIVPKQELKGPTIKAKPVQAAKPAPSALSKAARVAAERAAAPVADPVQQTVAQAPKAAAYAKAQSVQPLDPIAAPAAGSAPAQAGEIKPFRIFISIQRYNMENNGESNPISNVRLVVTFPNGAKVPLPEANQFWPIGNGQAQEINRTYELPWALVKNDGFRFSIQMERKGSLMLPCNFEVVQLSQFNRSYTCHTDTAWQQEKHIEPEKQDREGIQVRIFSDKLSEPKEIPQDAIAIR
jgi:hypothetical protein